MSSIDIIRRKKHSFEQILKSAVKKSLGMMQMRSLGNRRKHADRKLCEMACKWTLADWEM